MDCLTLSPQWTDSTDEPPPAAHDVDGHAETVVESPPLPPPSPAEWRERAVAAMIFLVFSLLAWRLIDLQVVRHDQFVMKALRQQTWDEVIPARPGNIVDRHGRLLATTTVAQSLYVDPARVDDPELLAAQLGPIVGIDTQQLRQRISNGKNKRFLWIKRRLSNEEYTQLCELKLPRQTVGFRQEFLRHYPQGALAAHVLGLRNIDGKGRGGIEESRDEWLQGTDGLRHLRRDARGFVLEVLKDQSVMPQHGHDVVLTLDSVIQLETEARLDTLMEEWKPTGACAVVIDPQTGEVLAMASRPTFDPNHPATAPANGWKNLVLDSAFEPGSTFKPCITAWAIDRGQLDPFEVLNCERGAYRMGKRVLHDHHPYGNLSVEDVLVKSSNIGMAKIGERLGNAELHAACRAFGFGQRTGIDLPGEVDGMLRPLEKWDGYSTGSVPMGQEISATPLQIASAHAALANRGSRISPHVTKDCVSRDSISKKESPLSMRAPLGDRGMWSGSVVSSSVISPDIAHWIVASPMTGVVARGTGKTAQIDGLSVFGKTGTAQKVDPTTGRYSTSRHVCSFVCGAPSDAPKLIVLVSVDEPTAPGSHYGGTVAAPAARDILYHSLRQLRETIEAPTTEPPELLMATRPAEDDPQIVNEIPLVSIAP
ncbi:MAG: penicillin-binding protein 2 [Planctomycetaceae bacterium]